MSTKQAIKLVSQSTTGDRTPIEPLKWDDLNEPGHPILPEIYRSWIRSDTVGSMRLVDEQYLYERLIKNLAEKLAATGYASTSVEGLEVPEQRWRKAARAAGSSLGRKARTTASSGTIHAWLIDWPATDEERAIDLEQQRAAVNAVYPFLHGQRP